MSADFTNAPPPTKVGGLRAVPMHIRDLRAVVTLDAATGTGTVEATLDYVVGPHAGSPIFDLRQTVQTCLLDGAKLDVAKIAPRDVGAGPYSSIRLIGVEQTAGSAHKLNLTYQLATPAADLGGAYPPVLHGSNGRFRWSFGMSDLFAGRYLEAWFPSNLPFDQFPWTLELRITGTTTAHSLITNGSATVVGVNAWSVRFPDWFTTMSSLLELRPSDALLFRSSTVVLPVSRRSVVVETWKPVGGQENLPALNSRIGTLLAENETTYGAFLADRFVCFFHGAGGGMEYAGAATTSAGALGHEVFHSWFARGITPAAQSDGWWDEAYTSFRDDGDTMTEPFDFTLPPVELCSRKPFQRTTPTSAYDEGSRFFRGVAQRLGADRLRTLMGELYRSRRGTPLSTGELEAHLITLSGATDLVDAFHRFVYGFAEPTPDARIEFVTAPALWVRRAADGIATHVNPKAVQDNWIHARVRNGAKAGPCRHFVVTFTVRTATTTPSTYPTDFFPAQTATVGFDLAPGRWRTVSARLPAALAPARGTRISILASVHARRSHPVSGTRVREQASIAQRDMTID
ncbi:hypothetical protein [Nocardia sp. XZ_19_369]|uniref:hypothetical protein n=1 Tax=Nocardia sp. XZ_19_369 TaxID=2769487 RepID=UPI0018905070|nr:hypothetical protein [Nocardia sp. XZ_19_369]